MISARALIDSGCTGSCIDEGFVQSNRIPTQKSPITIPVFNADGTPNDLGKITHFVDAKLCIGEHKEDIQLAVVKLGSTPVFLGHDWLKKHNPSVDWNFGGLAFDRCPKSCGYIQEDFTMDKNIEPPPPYQSLEGGDRLFIMDWVAYIKEGLQERIGIINHQKPKYLMEFWDLFSEREFDQLPRRRPWDHVIELTPGFQPRNCKTYHLTLDEQKALDKFLEENLRTGRIHPSKSPMASPFFFVKKKDGTLWPVQDYKKLNEATIKNRYPLPLIQELIDKPKGLKFFTKLDVHWGYNNVRIKRGDEWKAAFKMNRGLFEPTVMFFGLTNSPATFQSMMNEILKDLVDDGHVLVYLDDILIFTMTVREHQVLVTKVMERLRENGLCLKPEKCSFEEDSVEYLGVVVGGGEVKTEPSKAATVANWKIPTCKRELQSFLGFMNFYRHFIQDFSKIAKPLHELTGNRQWTWGPAQAEAFFKL